MAANSNRNAVPSDDEVGGCCPIFKKRGKARPPLLIRDEPKAATVRGTTGDKSAEPRNSTKVAIPASGPLVRAERTVASNEEDTSPLPLVEVNDSIENVSQPSRMGQVKRRVTVAAANLGLVIGTAQHDEISFQDIRGVNDINCMTKTVGSIIATYMTEKEYSKASRGPVKIFIETWFKRSIPFIRTGLNMANVHISLCSRLI